jgi:hypothetical protein
MPFVSGSAANAVGTKRLADAQTGLRRSKVQKALIKCFMFSTTTKPRYGAQFMLNELLRGTTGAARQSCSYGESAGLATSPLAVQRAACMMVLVELATG